MKRVDLNCDMGESFGAWRLGHDEEMMPHITSANIACGFHAGDASVMRRTLQLAQRTGVAAGAHPGLPDLAGFGRRRMELTTQEAYDVVVYQLGALLGHAHAAGMTLAHVKPHGALYNMAVADAGLARAIARAVRDVDARFVLFGLSGSVLLAEAEQLGLRVAAEVFADRAYENDGTLTPREREGALIEDPDMAARRALRMVTEGVVRSRDGSDVHVRADTICIHGDGPTAAGMARQLRRVLESSGVRVVAPGMP